MVMMCGRKECGHFKETEQTGCRLLDYIVVMFPRRGELKKAPGFGAFFKGRDRRTIHPVRRTGLRAA
jgi:hypothetical protein